MPCYEYWSELVYAKVALHQNLVMMVNVRRQHLTSFNILVFFMMFIMLYFQKYSVECCFSLKGLQTLIYFFYVAE